MPPMTGEQRASLIMKLLLVLVVIIFAAVVWNYPGLTGNSEKKTKAKPQKAPTAQQPPAKTQEPPEAGLPTVHADVSKQPLADILKAVVSPERGITIVHCHLPGDPASEQLADIFNYIKKKYGRQVNVIRVGFNAQPEGPPGPPAMKLPFVIMIAGSEQVFEFQGLWSQVKVEKKVDELLFGLRRVDKDWRPVVPGMTPKNR